MSNIRSYRLDEWKFGYGQPNSNDILLRKDKAQTVSIPHDALIGTETDKDAPSGPSGGYYKTSCIYYYRYVFIPREWENDKVYLYFDGAMINAQVNVNGSDAALHHYGYSPFWVDLTDYLTFGEDNRITVTLTPDQEPFSRWYSGMGLYRPVYLVHTPRVHFKGNALYAFTKNIDFDAQGNAETAYLEVRADIQNDSLKKALVRVTFYLTDRQGQIVCQNGRKAESQTLIEVGAGKSAQARQTLTLDAPKLWNDQHPYCYQLHAKAVAEGTFTTHIVKSDNACVDEDAVTFGVRTISADARHGLRINGQTVKLKGACLHHDNGLLGAASLEDAEERKVRRLKEIGFNAIRTAHNPPSAYLLEVCDRLGMYVIDELFDVWNMAKVPGDYHLFFASDWRQDLQASVRRDRCHPSVIFWSTGNEICERGGLGSGYQLAAEIAEAFRSLDQSRLITNGICSFWAGQDDRNTLKSLDKVMNVPDTVLQNADITEDDVWERLTEAFACSLDVVGYNYLEDHYAKDHEWYPERVMLGTENYPNKIGVHWPMIEKTPYVIGDFTWTAVDYIGEAGVGKSAFLDEDDPKWKAGPFALMSHDSQYPWRLANDADLDICGFTTPQGYYRHIVFGSMDTALFSYDPAVYGKKELISLWGFTDVRKSWNWKGFEGKNVTLAVFSRADEVEIFVNGVSIGRKEKDQSLAAAMPYTFTFDTVFQPGKVEAVSYKGGSKVSADTLETTGAPAKISLTAEKQTIEADGESLAYVCAEVQASQGQLVPDADLPVMAAVDPDSSCGSLAGFGSSAPMTMDNYTKGLGHTYRGRALAIVRAGQKPGPVHLTVSSQAEGRILTAQMTLNVVSKEGN